MISRILERLQSGAVLDYYALRKEFDRQLITAALIRTKGNISRAANALGINRTWICRRMKALKITRANT